MSNSFRLTLRAAADLDAIADYTIDTWGLAQLETYLLGLNRRFQWLAENPLAGRERNDIHPGYRSHPEGSHVIFYIVDDDQQVDIIGIPHKSMDVSVFFT
ncbi:MAG: type II toxin-antitoxin system RelE/ParE family toxin [Gammaproteobacteria bacterium]|nr:MAG: type II toxin-antitoxin system RelE/ParE family toxin [Gammaproteobacteria bacterium]